MKKLTIIATIVASALSAQAVASQTDFDKQAEAYKASLAQTRKATPNVAGRLIENNAQAIEAQKQRLDNTLAGLNTKVTAIDTTNIEQDRREKVLNTKIHTLQDRQEAILYHENIQSSQVEENHHNATMALRETASNRQYIALNAKRIDDHINQMADDASDMATQNLVAIKTNEAGLDGLATSTRAHFATNDAKIKGLEDVGAANEQELAQLKQEAAHDSAVTASHIRNLQAEDKKLQDDFQRGGIFANDTRKIANDNTRAIASNHQLIGGNLKATLDNADAINTQKAAQAANHKLIGGNLKATLDNADDIKDNGAKITDNRREIETNGKLAGVVARAAAQNQSGIFANEDSIKDNRVEIEKNAKVIGAVAKGISQNQSDVFANQDKIADNRKEIDTNSQMIGVYGKAISQTGAEVKAQKEAVKTVSRSVDDNGKHIARNTTDISMVKAVQTRHSHAIATNHEDITRNNRNIANNSAEIHKNSVGIAQNKQDITDLRKAFEQQAEVMDGAMAQGIATSSLVMPYNVGKISTTVALGHSGSADAIAGGLGMRFTENFTARANVAYDTGSENVSVGAGVGYEW